MTIEKKKVARKPSASATTRTKPPAKPAAKALEKTATTKAQTSVAPAKPAARKPVVQSIAKPVAQPPKAAAPAKPAKPKKPKMVRDSFTFPKDEYAVLDVLKMRAAKLGSPVKKTELLRAGIKAIAAMQDAAFVAALQVVPSLKTGRPAKAN
ncbi:MAG: hypothetical protein V4858_15435 [Pseudomonadota bacterium]